MDILTVELKELDLEFEDAELRLSLPVLQLSEDEVEDARNNPDLLGGEADSAPSAHRVRFAGACLPIGQDCGVEATEAAEHQVIS